MTTRARINAQGAIAAPGVFQILGHNLTLAEAGALDLDISGYAGPLAATCEARAAGDGLTVEDNGQTDGVWSLVFTGAGAASLSIRAASGRVWNGRVVIR